MSEAPSVSTESAAKFDAYARDYRALHQRSIGSSGEDPEYFARYKLDCLRRVGAESPVLDYGCGIGNLTVHLGASFGEVHGSDPSRESLEAAKERIPTVQFWGPGESAPADHFGTVVVSGVLHHIAPRERLSALQEIYSKLRPGGQLVIFEHNPLNPLTQKAVRDCPFDDDAILLWPKELKSRLRAVGFEQIRLSYIVFFPRFLARLRPLEPHLGWLCAGAQTMTLARRPR